MNKDGGCTTFQAQLFVRNFLSVEELGWKRTTTVFILSGLVEKSFAQLVTGVSAALSIADILPMDTISRINQYLQTATNSHPFPIAQALVNHRGKG